MEEKYPQLTDRIQSTFIDTLLIVVLMFVISSILSKFDNVPDWVRIILFIGLFVYEPIFITFGCTLGNYLKKIRVRQNSDSTENINIFKAVLRYLFKLFLGWFSFLTINSNPKRRAIHDLVSGSVMIKL
jgi:uncharacterized RDD family membrane protein YckC